MIWLHGGRDHGHTFDEMPNVEVHVPGCYSNVSVSIHVRNLALNAVTQSALLGEMEKADDATALGSTFLPFNGLNGDALFSSAGAIAKS